MKISFEKNEIFFQKIYDFLEILPFNIENHEAAQSHVAAAFWVRLVNDMKEYSDMEKNARMPLLKVFAGLKFDDIFDKENKVPYIIEYIKDLNDELQHIRDRDAKMVQQAIPLLLKACSFIASNPSSGKS